MARGAGDRQPPATSPAHEVRGRRRRGPAGAAAVLLLEVPGGGGVIKRETVLTLRDLRGERSPEARTIPWGVDWVDHRILYAQALIELAGVAMEWRKDDRIDVPFPETTTAPHDEAVVYLVKAIAAVLVNDERVSVCQADCSLIASWEPVD